MSAIESLDELVPIMDTAKSQTNGHHHHRASPIFDIGQMFDECLEQFIELKAEHTASSERIKIEMRQQVERLDKFEDFLRSLKLTLQLKSVVKTNAFSTVNGAKVAVDNNHDEDDSSERVNERARLHLLKAIRADADAECDHLENNEEEDEDVSNDEQELSIASLSATTASTATKPSLSSRRKNKPPEREEVAKSINGNAEEEEEDREVDDFFSMSEKIMALEQVESISVDQQTADESLKKVKSSKENDKLIKEKVVEEEKELEEREEEDDDIALDSSFCENQMVNNEAEGHVVLAPSSDANLDAKAALSNLIDLNSNLLDEDDENEEEVDEKADIENEKKPKKKKNW